MRIKWVGWLVGGDIFVNEWRLGIPFMDVMLRHTLNSKKMVHIVRDEGMDWSFIMLCLIFFFFFDFFFLRIGNDDEMK